MSEFKVFLKP